MEFIINNTAKYNAINGTLFSPENSIDMLTLSRISNELLLLFIQNRGVLLNRETILNELWENRGLTASSNNLNNHVSILRKALVECGCAGVIITVPKQGFLFDAQIESVESYNNLILSFSSVIEKETSISEEITVLKKKPQALFSIGLLKKMSLCSLFIITFFGIYNFYDYMRVRTIRNEIFRLDQCRFYLIDDLTRRIPNDKVIKRIQEIFFDQKIQCDTAANVYYSSDKKIDSQGNYIFTDLLSYCPYNSKAPCENYFYTGKYN